MKHSVLFAGVLAAAALPGVAEAASITVGFEFSVYSVSAPLAGTFSIGQKAVGSFTYETTTPGVDYAPVSGNPALPNFQYYAGALTGFSFTLAGMTFTGGGNGIVAVANDETTYGNGDYINLIDYAAIADDVAGLAESAVSFLFVDQTLAALSSPALPDPFPGADNYDGVGQYSNLDIFYGPTGDGIRVSLSLDKLSAGNGDPDPIPVPEPASLVLLGTALLGLGWHRRRS